MGKRTSKKSKKKLKRAALIIGTAAIVAGRVSVQKRYVDPREKVVSVIDGDSLVIGNEQTIKLASLDAPELEYCFGKEAKEALTKKIDGKKVILKELKTDMYGRIRAMVYINGESVNEYMIKNGFATRETDISSLKNELLKSNDFARKNNLGIFSEKCTQKEPPNEKCNIKGNIFYARKSKEYIMPSCEDYKISIIAKYKGEQWFCSEKEAIEAGYVKSKNCK